MPRPASVWGGLSVVAGMLPGMDAEEFMRGRVYGADHDDPHVGPRAGHVYRELVGGPLDGLLLDVTGWEEERLCEGAALATEIGAFGPGGRAVYRPRPGDARRWDWCGDMP